MPRTNVGLAGYIRRISGAPTGLLLAAAGTALWFAIMLVVAGEPALAQDDSNAISATTNGRPRALREFGAKCDGKTDDGPAFQAAIDAQPTVRVIAAGCPSFYLVNTTVVVPAGHAFVSESNGTTLSANKSRAGQIVTSRATDTFATAGSGTMFKGLYVLHRGNSGSVVRNATGRYMTIEGCLFVGQNAASSDPVVYLSGSSGNVGDTRIEDNRATGSFAIDLDRTAKQGLNIEAHLWRNEISGKSSGIIVHASEGALRPEGVHIENNTFVNVGEYYIRTEQVLFEDIIGNTFDQGGGHGLYFSPVGPGIDSVIVTGNWISDEDGGRRTGDGIVIDNANAGAGAVNFTISSNVFRFLGNGIALTDSANGVVISNNVFSGIASGASAIKADRSYRVSILGNIFQYIKGKNLILADGGKGGPFLVDQNQFCTCAGFEIEKTNKNKIMFGNMNSGYPLP